MMSLGETTKNNCKFHVHRVGVEKLGCCELIIYIMKILYFITNLLFSSWAKAECCFFFNFYSCVCPIVRNSPCDV